MDEMTTQELPTKKNSVEQLLIGSLLGDGYLFIRKNCINAVYGENHSLKQKEYLRWKGQILSKKFKIKHYNYQSNPKSKWHYGKTYYVIIMYTNSSSYLTKLYKEFYPYKKKRITINILNKLKISGIAIWYQDDGTYNKKDKTISIAINKKSKNVIIQYFKKMNLNPRFYIQKNTNAANICFRKNDSQKLLRKMKTYAHPSMLYKWGINNNVTN
jgi:hypothetical protein